MKWLKVQSVVLVVALVVAATQCVANCLTQPCHETAAASSDSRSLPPCHRHQAPKPVSNPQSCKSSVLIAETRASSVTLNELKQFETAGVIADDSPVVLLEAERLLRQKTKPPIFDRPDLSTILRI